MYKVQRNLCFRKSTIQAGLIQSVPALNKVFKTPLKQHQEAPWSISISRRVASMCRHTSQVLLKAKSTSWAHKMLAGASSEEEVEEGGEEADDGEEEEEEEAEEEADEEEEKTADAEMPTDKVDTYSVGYCRQARKAWRLDASGKKKKSGLR